MSKSQLLVVYAGRRFIGDIVRQLFYELDAKGKPTEERLCFRKVKNPVIGASYHVDVDGEKTTISVEPPRVSDMVVDESLRDKWWAEQRADMERFRAKRAEKALAAYTPPSVQSAISSLTGFGRTLKSYSELKGLVDFITQEAWRRSRPGYKAEPVKTRKKTKKRSNSK